MTHRKGRTRERPSRRGGMPKDVDAVVVSLVRAGAPKRLLWAEPDVVDLEALPKGSLLRQQIEDAESEYEFEVGQREALFCFMSRAWSGLKLLYSEWLLHCRS